MYSHQRSKVTCMWKIIFVECRPVGGQRGSIGTLTQSPGNAGRDFLQTHARNARWLACKSQERAASGYFAFSR